jgi:hypothetical protein
LAIDFFDTDGQVFAENQDQRSLGRRLTHGRTLIPQRIPSKASVTKLEKLTSAEFAFCAG